MGNLFLKYNLMDGLSVESFTTVEAAKGGKASEASDRKANQFATDLIFRFGKADNFFLGARYNTVSADVPSASPITAVSLNDANGTKYTLGQDAVPAYKQDISRLAISGGWFMTKNIMAKLEYVNQKYKGVPNVNYILNGAKFNGLTAEAVIAF